MAGFLYFIPNVTPDQLAPNGVLDRERLSQAGIAEVLADVLRAPEHASLCGVNRQNGPGDQAGTVLVPVSPATGVPECVIYDPPRQVWRPMLQGDGWAGVITTELPGALDLCRWDMVRGYAATDSATQVWQVPLARRQHAEYGYLPQVFTFDGACRPRGTVSRSARWLWDLSAEIAEGYANQADRPLNLVWLAAQAVKILGFNYRLGPSEINLLAELGREMLTDYFVHFVCQAVYGLDLLETAKKKEPETPTESALNSCSLTTGDAIPPGSPITLPVTEG